MTDRITRLELALPGVTITHDITAESPGTWRISKEAAAAYWNEDAGVYAIPIVGEKRKRLIQPELIETVQQGMWPTKPLPAGYTWERSPLGGVPSYAFLDVDAIITTEQAAQSRVLDGMLQQLDLMNAKLEVILAKLGGAK